MKQLAQYQDGRLEIQEVPVPAAPPGGILVKVTHSVISPGTEKMKVEQARMNLLQKARARPDQVRKVLDTARTLGWKAAMDKVRNRLESPSPLGYSASGIVAAVHETSTRFRVGDRVACGGAECAHHAEYIAVPDLLAAPVPDAVENWQAAYTTLASISMEAVRQAGLGLGDRVLVIGQGLIGQLVTSLCRINGARVFAVDLDEARLRVSTAMGAERTASARTSPVLDAVMDWTLHHGVDTVILCTGGRAQEPVKLAVDALRDRGVMVIAGMQDAELDWKTCYAKDIQVRYSRSYGPGRYDPAYEWAGKDYPIGYVRWTENRNFEACLQLMADGRLGLTPITTSRATFTDAVSVYENLMRSDNADIGVVLTYDSSTDSPSSSSSASELKLATDSASPKGGGVDLLHVIGAGNFARTMLLPHLKGILKFGTVVNQTGLSARHTAEKFSFQQAETSLDKAFESADNAAVLIGTRHHLHASLVLQGLRNHRHVFVEKPLCLTRDELDEIDTAVASSRGSVMVGFNRRFAPATVAIKQHLAGIPGPKSLVYEVCAGPLSPDHWYANTEHSGGRILGEVCHFMDYACHVLGSEPVSLSAQAVRHAAGGQTAPDSVAVQVAFSDGSTFQLLYTSAGDPAFPKETCRIFGRGIVLACENFMTLSVFQNRKQSVKKFHSKGHAEEMQAWSSYLKHGGTHPLPYAEARVSTLLTFAIPDAIRRNTLLQLT